MWSSGGAAAQKTSTAYTPPRGEPAKWSVKQLLNYCSANAINVQSGLEKKELIKLVDAHYTTALLNKQLADTLLPNPERLQSLAGLSGEALLRYQPYDAYGEWLLEDHEALRRLVEAGIAQLNDVDAFKIFVKVNQVPPLVSWMTASLHMSDAGKSAAATLTPAAARATVCGRYLGSGEMVARCEECAADGTCVFCMDCFQHSPCRHHRVRITQSGGGGMCDCGDPSAWRKESFCSHHCGHSADEDPTAVLGEKQKTWAVLVLRGAVQALSLVLHQSLACTPSSNAGETRERMATLRDWLESLVSTLYTLSQASEVAKRLLSERWVEAMGDASGVLPHANALTTNPCLDAIFRFELSVTDYKTDLKAENAWWLSLVKSIGAGLADPFFRSHFIGMMGKYAERLSKNDALDDYSVQVFTNVDAVHYALTPRNLPYQNPADNIVHRSISGCLYYLTAILGDKARFNAADPSSLSLANLVLDDSEDGVNLAAFGKLRQCVGLSPEAGVFTVLNRRVMRGIQVFLHIIDISSAVHKNENAPARRFVRTPTFAGRYMTLILRFMQNNTRKVLRAYDDVSPPGARASSETPPENTRAEKEEEPGEEDGSTTAFDDVDRRCLEKLGVSPEVMEEVFRCGLYDTPPDAVAASSKAHAAALSFASDPTDACGGRPSRDQISSSLSAAEWEDRAFRSLLMQLHLVREFLVSYLQEQQETFRHGNAAVVLEARPPAASSTTAASGAEHHIYQYSLLEPASHAVGTTNLISRLFMLLVHAWVMHCTRRRSVSGAHHSDTNDEGVRVLRSRLGPARSAEAGLVLTEASDEWAHRTQPVTRLAKILIAHSKLPGARALLRNAWLDTVVMPTVLLAQVDGGLWRRDDYNVSNTMGLYQNSMTKTHMEYDLYAIQMLATIMPPNDLAVQILERFSFDNNRKAKPPVKSGDDCNTRKALYPRGLRPGYGRYIRLMLTLVLDSSKACGGSDVTQATITRMVAQVLSVSRSTHSAIATAVERSLMSGLEEDEEFDEINIKVAIRTALKAIAVEEEGSSGRVFRLKDTATWEKLVCLYSPECTDVERDSIFGQYRTTVRLANLAKGADAAETTADAKKKPVHFPPPSLPTDQATELVPHLRALLHTDALLLASIAVLLAFAKTLRDRKKAQSHQQHDPAGYKKPSEGTTSAPPAGTHTRVVGATTTGDAAITSSDSDDDSDVQSSGSDFGSGDWETSSDDERRQRNPLRGSAKKVKVVGNLLKSTVQHAVTALYLSAKDTAELSRALCYQNSCLLVAQGAAEHATVPPEDSPVDWERVASYMRETMHGTVTYTDKTLSRVLPLASLRQSGTLRDVLSKAVPHARLSAPAAGEAAYPLKRTIADVLHEVWRHERENAEDDSFGLAHMLRYILTMTGLAREEVLKDDEDSEKVSMESVAALARSRQLQERQAKILRRMRIRATTALAEDKGEGGSTSASNTAARRAGDAGETEAEGGKRNNESGGVTARDGVFLLTRLLFRLSALDCCVCRQSTAEPLLFLANCSTSGVLHHLDAMPLPDTREVHSHVNMCGHVTHAKCVRKYFARLATLWQRGYFQGQRFLGPSEFSCPICLMVSQVQAPVPTITSTTSTAPGQAKGRREEDAEEKGCGKKEVVGHNEQVSFAPSSKSELLFEELRRHSLAENEQQEAAKSTCAAIANAAIGFCDGADNPALVRKEDDLQHHNNEAWVLSETIRTIAYQLHILVEGAKAGRTVSEHDLLVLLSLMISVTPAQLAAHQSSIRENFTRCAEPHSLLILDCLMAPAVARDRIAAAAMELVSSPDASKTALCVLEWVVGAGARRDTEAASVLAQPESEQMFMSLWTEFACLTLLKILLVEEPADVVIGTLDSAANSDISILPLTTEALASADARRNGFLRMWQCLSLIAARHLTDSREEVAAQLKDALVVGLRALSAVEEVEEPAGGVGTTTAGQFRTPPPPHYCTKSVSCDEEGQPARLVVYENPAQWAMHLLVNVLHLPAQYVSLLSGFAQQKACHLCGSDEGVSVQCRYCESRLCLKPPEPRRPELYHHSVQCGRGIGVFLRVGVTTLLITDAVSGRCVEPRSLYVDEYDETDEQMSRGAPLYLSATEATKFLHTWIMNRWAVDSSLLKRTWRGNLSVL